MSQIPDAAVQAFRQSFESTDNNCETYQDVRKALTAALPHLSAPCAVEVDKLHWDGLVGFVGSFSYVVAPPSFTKGWRVWGKLSDKSASVGGVLITTTAADEEEAKAAAQADFERRILSCVVTKPVDIPALLQEVRSGERDGFINTGQEPHGNDADLSCPCCGGSGHKDDAKPVDVAAVRRQAFDALKKAEQFIENGVELGFIRLPEQGDPALETLPLIKDAIRALSSEPAQYEKAWYFKKGDTVPSWLEKVEPDVRTLTFGADVVVTTINGFYEIRPETINDVGVPIIVVDAQNQPISVTGQGKGVSLISYDREFKSVNIDPAQGEQSGITISSLQAAHIERQKEWCPDQQPDLSFRGNEMAGEVGEACNVIKKLERERQGWRGSRSTKEELASELADVIHTAILCAVTAGIDLEAATVEKFNATSDKNALRTRLPAAQTTEVGK